VVVEYGELSGTAGKSYVLHRAFEQSLFRRHDEQMNFILFHTI